MKALIIEDDQDLALYLKVILEEEGFEVKTAHSGGAGLEIAREEVPDLLLLDINLPTVDGFEICRILKGNEKTEDITIIAVSSLEKFSDYTKMADAGAAAFVGKPVDKEELLIKINKHLKK